MNNFYKLMLLAVFALAGNMVQGQTAIWGTKTIPSTNYPTVKIAIDSINLLHVGSPGVIFNITPGHYERTSSSINILNDSTTGRSIVFKKNGAGANPIITAGVGVGTRDAVIRIEGTDSVTFDGLELRDTTLNTTTTQMMEYGIIFFRRTNTNGSNNCKVINCVITLQKSHSAGTGSVAVSLVNTNSSGTAINPITSGYLATNLFIDNNTISNVTSGIYISSVAQNSPFYDPNVTISNNNITNFGNSSLSYNGIRFDQCTNSTIYNNTISGGTGNTTTCYGIYNTGNDSMSNTVRKNTITLTPANTSSQITGINFASYSGAIGTLTIDSNTITNCTASSVATSEWDGIKLTTSLNFITSITANNITNNLYGTSTVTATGAFYPIFVSAGSNINSGSSLTINGNVITGNRKVQSANGGGNNYMIYLTAENLTTFINNNTITNDIFPGSGDFAGIYNNSTSSTYRKIFNNSINNNTRLHGIVANSSGLTYGILSTHGTGVDTIINNTVRDYSILGTGTFSGISMLSGAGGVKYLYADSIYNISDSGAFNGITQTSTGTNSVLTIRKCYINNNTAKSTTGLYTGIYATFSSVGTSNYCFIDSNTLTNNSSPLSTSGGMQHIVCGAAFNITIKANNITNNTLGGGASATATGVYYGINTLTANTNALSSVTISNNYFVGNKRLQSSIGAGVSYGIYCGASSVNQTINNNYIAYNTFQGNTNLYGIHALGSTASGTWNINNNTITRMYRSSTSLGTVAGILLTPSVSTITANVYNNSVDSFSTMGTSTFLGIQNSGAGTVNIYNDSIKNIIVDGQVNYCIYQAGGGVSNIYRNRIGNITNRNVITNNWGIMLAAGTTNNVYNNIISNMHSPISNNFLSLVGINASAGANDNIYYNTVRLNGTTTVSGFGSAAFYSSTTPTAIDVRNNIFVNTSTQAGTGQTVAFRRTAVAFTNYRDSSGNNIYYAGTPSSTNLLYSDGTVTRQTVDSMRTMFRVLGQVNRDMYSYSENVSFIDTNYNSVNWMKVDSTTASSIEGGGQNLYFKTTDDHSNNAVRTGYPKSGQTYGGGALPDIGAHETDGTPVTPMSYVSTSTATATTLNTGRYGRNQQLLRFEVVTTGQYNPNVISNFHLNPNGTDNLSDLFLDSTRIFYTGNLSTFDTFQLVKRGTMASPTYNITSTFPLTPGSNYFWMTFDVKPTASVNDTVDAELEELTIAGTTYTINAAPIGERVIYGPMCGNYTVGAIGYNFSTIGGALYDLYARGVDTTCTSRVTLSLMDANYSTSETFPLMVQEIPNASYNGRSIILKPNTGVDATITGASNNSLFMMYGTDYFTIDGSNNGTTSRNLTFYNSQTDVTTQSYDVIRLVAKAANSGCKLDTIRNCTVQAYTGVFSTGSALGTYGITAGGSTTVVANIAGYDMDSVAIYNNIINKVHVGIYMANSSGTNKSDRVYIGYNEIGSLSGSETVEDGGIFVQNIDNSRIEHNHIFNLRQYNWITSPVGIDVSTGVTNTNIRKNKIHSTGFNQSNGNAMGSIGIRINTATTTAKDTLANNILYDISGTGSTASANGIVGMLFTTGQTDFAVFNNSINLAGSIGRAGATIDTSACIWMDGVISNINMRNNVLVNKLNNTAGTQKGYCINGRLPSSFTTTTDDNDYYISGSQNNIGFISSSNRATLANWQSAVGTVIDSGSISSNPLFNNDTCLNGLPSSPLTNGGEPLYSVTDDYNGLTRSITTPTIGALENIGDVIVPVISYTPIQNTSNTANYTQNNFATVTDAYSNPVKNVRLYYKKSTDANTYVGNTSANNGWKYVNGTGSSPFSFVIDSSIIFGGAFTVGDQVQYFVVAEDSVSTPSANVAINSGNFAATPTASLLTSAAFPITGTINSYYVSNPISGTIVVDSAGGTGIYTTLTGSNGAFNYINSSILGGDVTIQVQSNTVEPGTIALNNPTCSGGTYNLYIKPNNTTTRLISGSVANAMIRLNGAQNIIFDGRDPGTLAGMYLNFRNTNTSNAVFAFTADCKKDTVEYCIIEGANVNNSASPTSTVNANGIIYIGVGSTNGNDSIVISNNKLGNISNSLISTVGIYSEGTSSSISNDAIFILNNEIYNFRDYGVYGFGTTNGPNWNISGNSFYNNLSTPPTTGQFGIRFEPGSIADRTTVNNNYVGGSSANCGGAAWVNSGTGNVFNGIRLSLGTGDTSNIQGNVIKNISLTNTAAGHQFAGLSIQSNGIMKVGTSIPNMVGDTAAASSITIAGQTNHYGCLSLTSNYIEFANNYITSIAQSNTVTSTLNILDIRNGTALVHDNTIGDPIDTGMIYSNGTGTMQGIATSGSGTSAISVYNNTVSGLSYNNPTAGALNGITATGTSFSPTIYNNTFGHSDGSYGTYHRSPGTVTGINCSATGTPNIYNNTISGLNLTNTGAGAFTGINYIGAGTNGGIYNNTIGHNSTSNSITMAGTGQFAGISQSNVSIRNADLYSNLIANISRSSTGTYTNYGIFNSTNSDTTGTDIYSNTIRDISFAGTATTYGISSANSATPSLSNRVHDNIIKSLSFTSSSGSCLFFGVYCNSAGDFLAYNNIIGDASTTGNISMNEATTVGGIYNNSATDTIMVYNNTFAGITINNSSTSPNMYGFAYVPTSAYPNYLIDSLNTFGNASADGSITINGGGTFYGHSFPSSISITGARGINIRNNSIGGITRTSTGSANTYGIYDSWQNAGGLQSPHNINDNTISNWNMSNVGITTAIFCNLGTSRNSFVYNNSVKGFTFTNTGTGGSFSGIAITAGKVLLTQPDSASAGNNVIGDPSVSNSINSAMNGPHNGISTSSANAISIIGNIVNNITATSTGTSCVVGGIACGNGATATTINSNTVKNLSGAGTTTNGFNLGGAVCGIYTTSTSTMTVNNNIMNGIILTSTGTASNAYGIDLYLSGNTTVNSNRIYNMSSTSNGNLTGLYFNSTNASTHVIKNNQISIENGVNADFLPIPVSTANGANTNDLPIQGIYADNAAGSGTVQMYYNTVFLSGSISSGSKVSASYFRNSTTGTTNVLNNIFMNSRTGGSGNHVAQTYTGGITNNRTNYNLNITADSNVAVSVSGTNWDINAWRNGLKRDSSGWYAIAGTNVVDDSMFTDKTNGDLGINNTTSDAWYANGKGLQTPGYADEYGNTASVRSTTVANGAPDLGSDEFTPTSHPDELFSKGPHTNGNVDSLMYGFRPVAYIKWRGDSIPTFSAIRYYTGETPPDNTNNGNNPSARYMNCYWWISATSGTTEYDINFMYDDALVGSLTSESALRISRKEVGVVGSWKAHTADATVNTTTNNMQLLNTRGFSIWTGSDNASPLPVTLVSFTGQKQDKNVMLKWVSSFEEQMDGYEVEFSADAQNFNSIGFVKAVNNRFSENNYNLLHTSPVKGNNYYRLKSIESNGKFTYSNIVVVNFDEIDRMQIVIQPNPSKDQVSVILQNQTQPALIQVYDMAGRLMFNEKVSLGQSATQVNLSGWNLGSYILRVTNDDGTSFINRIMKIEE